MIVQSLSRQFDGALSYVWQPNGLMVMRTLITDFSMPKMNGAQLPKAAKEISPHLAILIATGYGELTALSDVELPLGRPMSPLTWRLPRRSEFYDASRIEISALRPKSEMRLCPYDGTAKNRFTAIAAKRRRGTG